MVNFDLMKLVNDYYGSRHYLFMVVKANEFELPVDWQYGDAIKLPPRGNRRALAEAEYRRKTSTYNPVGA